VYRDVRAVQERVLGPERPDTLTTTSNLANALPLGKNTTAEKMLLEVLAARQRVLGPEHPDTLWTVEMLAFYARGADGV
jgi:hypothetical protein